MSINNNIGEYNTKTFIYISCTRLMSTILRHLYTYNVLLCLDTLYIQVLKTY